MRHIAQAAVSRRHGALQNYFVFASRNCRRRSRLDALLLSQRERDETHEMKVGQYYKHFIAVVVSEAGDRHSVGGV